MPSTAPTYRGRFAPSPTGPLHAGSLVAALASYLDAKANGGAWLVRIEDVDTPRCRPEYAQQIMVQLAACGLHPDEEVVYQSARTPLYQAALVRLQAQQLVYPCSCSRKDLALLASEMPQNAQEPRYPGLCRTGLRNPQAKQVAWRVRTTGEVEKVTGDFVLKRADGLWAYQLAVVVDDAAQGVTHVVRGLDLLDNTARQNHLQSLLGLPRPAYLHTPLVLADNGLKLSKQNKAPPLNTENAHTSRQALEAAAAALGLPPCHCPLEANHTQVLRYWIEAWPQALQSGLAQKKFIGQACLSQ